MPDFGLGALIKGVRAGSAVRRAIPLEEQAAEQVMKRVPAAVEPPPAAAFEPSIQQTPPLTEPPPPQVHIEGEAPQPPQPPLSVKPAAVDAGEEAVRLQKLNLGDYDLGESWQPNYDVINGPDDMKAVIADAAERINERITAARRGVVSDDQLRDEAMRALAEDMGADTSVVSVFMRREAGGNLPPPGMVYAARLFINNSADRLITLAKQIAAHEASPMDQVRFRRQIQLHDEFLVGFMGVRAEYGRGLNAFGIPLGVEKNPLARKKLIDMVENMNHISTEELAGIIAKQTSTAGVAKAVKRLTRSKLEGTLNELFANAILSGIKTHVINNLGSALMIGANVAASMRPRHFCRGNSPCGTPAMMPFPDGQCERSVHKPCTIRTHHKGRHNKFQKTPNCQRPARCERYPGFPRPPQRSPASGGIRR